MNDFALVTVYDPDGLNPYGREIAALLARAGHSVRLLAPADVEWTPSGVDVARVLPATGSRSRPAKALQLARGLVRLITDAVRGRTIFVCWSWYVVEKLGVALAALIGRRLVLVVHNPGGRGPVSNWTSRAERLERRFAGVLVTHSERLVRGLPASKSRVCVHPPYTSYVRDLGANVVVPRPKEGSVTTLLSLGALRADKGLDLLAGILGRVTPANRAGLRLRIIGRDRERGRGIVDSIAPLVPVVNDLRERGVPDAEVVSALLDADALLAFYPGATQSGSAILALTGGIRVLGFNTGALPEIILPEFLAPADDLDAAAALIEDLLADRLPSAANAMDLDTWEARAVEEWSSVVEDIARRR